MVARDFNPWFQGFIPFPLPARRADGAIVRSPGENRKEDIAFQGLKPLAMAVRPIGRRLAVHYQRRSDQAETILPADSESALR